MAEEVRPASPAPATVDESMVIARVEAARKEEKAKLYDHIQKAKQTEEENRSLRDEIAKYKAAPPTPTPPPAPTALPTISDPSALVQAVRQQLEPLLAERLKPFETEQARLKREIEDQKLSRERERLIIDAKGLIIPEMVVGETIEELRSNAEKSKAKYTEIAKSVAPATPAAPAPHVNPAVPAASPSVPAPAPVGAVASTGGGTAVPGVGSTEGEFIEKVKSMTPQDYRTHRLEAKSKLKELHPTL